MSTSPSEKQILNFESRTSEFILNQRFPNQKKVIEEQLEKKYGTDVSSRKIQINDEKFSRIFMDSYRTLSGEIYLRDIVNFFSKNWNTNNISPQSRSDLMMGVIEEVMKGIKFVYKGTEIELSGLRITLFKIYKFQFIGDILAKLDTKGVGKFGALIPITYSLTNNNHDSFYKNQYKEDDIRATFGRVFGADYQEISVQFAKLTSEIMNKKVDYPP